MKVSIIIPTYNNKDSLRMVLSSVLNQSLSKSDYEIIVVDDGGDDGTREMIESLGKDILYFWQEDLGFRAGQARNLGVRNAGGEFLIFLDDDTVVPHNFIENHLFSNLEGVTLGYNASYGSDKDYDINDVKDFLKEGNKVGQLKVIPEFRDEWFKDSILRDSKTNQKLWFVFASGNMSMKKSLFNKFMFDEEFIGWAEEDVELGYRMQSHGIRIILNQECIGYNIRQSPEGMKSMITKGKFLSTTKNQILLFKKHPHEIVKEYIMQRYEHAPEEFKKGTFIDVDNFIFKY